MMQLFNEEDPDWFGSEYHYRQRDQFISTNFLYDGLSKPLARFIADRLGGVLRGEIDVSS